MLFIYLFLSNCFLQTNNVVIFDKINKQPVAYSSIKFIGSKNGIYADENGTFDLSKIISDSIQISNLGYLTSKLKTSELNDTIYLIQNSEILSEIIIKTGNYFDKSIGYKNKKSPLSWFINPKTELSTLINYKKELKNCFIKKIHIPIGKERTDFNQKKITKSNFNNVFRVNLYTNNNNKPGKSLLKKPILIECNQDSKEVIDIDIENEFIKYPDEGVHIGVEMIGKLDANKKIIDTKTSILPSFKFTKQKEKKIISNSYIKMKFFGNDWINLKNSEEFNHISKYNMAVSLTLSVYEK
jgi:hypothetical protein